MIIIDRAAISSDKRKLIDRVHAHLEIQRNDAFVLLDDARRGTYHNPRYGVAAFFMNIRSGGVEETSPEHIVEIMKDSNCHYFIWISKDMVEADDFPFVWVYSHELQHLRQEISDYSLSRVNSFIRRVANRVLGQSITQLALPAELEAELVAKDTLCAFFGKQAFEEYREAEQLQDPAATEYFDHLLRLESESAGALRHQTARLLQAHKEGFRRELRRLTAKDKFRDVDIESLFETAVPRTGE